VADEIKRVEREFILKSLHERRTPLEIHLGRERLRATVEGYSEDQVRLSVDDERVPERGQLRVFFRFRNNAMTFTSAVLSSVPGQRVLAMPEGVYRGLGRAFERIERPDGVSVAFLHKGQEVRLSYPDSEQYDPVEDPGFDPGFDTTKIDHLVAEFRRRGQRFASDTKIVMFRERRPQAFPERIISTTGKMLPLPFETGERVIPSEALDRLLTQDEVVSHEIAAGGDMFQALAKIGQATEEALEEGIRQELYCPILYHQYVVGYLYLMKTGTDGDRLEPEAFGFVQQFARIFAYSLKVNGYFSKGVDEGEYQGAQLIDVSGSGVLFSIAGDGPAMLLYTDIDLRITVGQDMIPSRGRVMRKYSDAQRTYVAVQFIELDPDDMETLMVHIYGEQYRGDVDSVGFADPANLASEEF
jgi:hypothetical protein